MAKSVTLVVEPAEVVKFDPATVSVALFPNGPEPVGVMITVTVAVAAAFRAPIAQLNTDGVPLGVPQLPGLAVADTNVPETLVNCSVKFTPVTKSPLLVIVYLKVTWFPMPAGLGVAAAATMARVTCGANFATKASLVPLRVCNGLTTGKLAELVSPTT